MKKVLMCTGEENSFGQGNHLFDLDKNSSIEVTQAQMFLERGRIHRLFRNLGKFLIKKELHNVWHSDLSQYDALILFDPVVKNSAISYIRKKNPNLRIILYFRNQFSSVKKRNIDLNLLNKLNCEFWSYNKNDCIKYGFSYNNQFWNSKLLDYIPKLELQYDCVFNGRTKHRELEIIKLSNLLEEKKIHSFFYLFPKTEYSFDRNKKNEFMDYLTYLKIASQSKAIIDLVGITNYGLTLRPLEALFLNKKLITNYKDINQYDFYKKENIFILGKDSIEELESFLNSPNVSILEKNIVQYDYKMWINHFFSR